MHNSSVFGAARVPGGAWNDGKPTGLEIVAREKTEDWEKIQK